ncbi:MAG: HAMP domain-containing histidine kinase [Candidatus Cloacimonetes bacterium]|nr:HAMP domain-containing histidine kinase [Candidatus Cloacimonadota bacterium]
MAYKVGSLSRIVMYVNIAMCITAGTTVYFYLRHDYFAAWILLLCTGVILSGVPNYTVRLIRNATDLIKSYNQNLSVKQISMPGFADELQELNHELNYLQVRTRENRNTNAVSAVLIENIIENIPFALIVFDDKNRIYYCNYNCKLILGEYIEYLTACTPDKMDMINKIKEIPTNKQIVFKDNTGAISKEFLISKNSFSMDNSTYHIISMKNIKSEMDTQEMVSWQKLIRVLNHEIMNSLTPISSLSEAMLNMFNDAPDFKQKETIKSSLALISKRSVGLMEFVHRYRKISALEKPEFKPVNVKTLIEDTIQLLVSEISALNVDLKVTISDSGKTCLMDTSMFQQVLINLFRNSLESMTNVTNPTLKIILVETDTETSISVIDNGIGISPEALPNIFVPFFTTKNQGSGIGLTLTKQIVGLHKGEISVKSDPFVETEFKITIPI